MRRASHIDATQPEIVAALRSIGASVQSLAAVGKGVPDLLVGYRGRNYLVECKTIHKGTRKARFKASQNDWHAKWAGQVVVLHSADQALEWLTASADFVRCRVEIAEVGE